MLSKFPSHLIEYILSFNGFTDFIRFSQTCKEAKRISKHCKRDFALLTPSNYGTFDCSRLKTVILFEFPDFLDSGILQRCEHLTFCKSSIVPQTVNAQVVFMVDETYSLKGRYKQFPNLREYYFSHPQYSETATTYLQGIEKCPVEKIVVSTRCILDDEVDVDALPLKESLKVLIAPGFCMTSDEKIDQVYDRTDLDFLVHSVGLPYAIHSRIEHHHQIPNVAIYGLSKRLIRELYLPLTQMVNTWGGIKQEFLD